MKLSRHIALGSAAVIGLMFLAGTGCGPKNEGEKVMMQVMQRDLATAAKERERVEARARCLHEASDEKNEAKRKDAVNNCYKLHSI